MAIRYIDDNDRILVDKINRYGDPFEYAIPVWKNPDAVLQMLPEVVICTRDSREQQIRKDIEKIMAVKLVEEKTAPDRLHQRGTIALTPEYRDTLTAIKTIPEGKAIVITLEHPELTKLKKPEVTFAYTLRRYLASHNIAATAYQSGKLEVVVRRDALGSAARKRGPNKKK